MAHRRKVLALSRLARGGTVGGMKWLAALAVFGCTHPAQTPKSASPAELDRAAAAITADDLRRTITDLSADKLEGRGPTTAADQATRAYLIDRLHELGYAPGANGSWEQPFELVGIKAAMPSDEIQPTWNFAGMIQDAQLGFAVGATIASGGDAPAFVPGDEFAHARK